MSLRHPGGLSSPSGKRGRLVDASWGEVITHPTVIILSSLFVFTVTFAAMSWFDGSIRRLFIAKGATIDTSSRSWMGSANGSRISAAPKIVVPSDADLKQAQTAAKEAARKAQSAADAADIEVGDAGDVTAE